MKVTGLYVGFIFLLVGCDNHSPNAEMKPKQQQNSQRRMEVKVTRIQVEKIPLSEELPARVRAYKTAEIRPQVEGIIRERFFEEGSYVEQGDQLYQIDSSRYEAQYEMAQAKLQRAKATKASVSSLVNRYAILIRQNAVSSQEYDNARAKLGEAKADVSMAQAEVKTAKINLDYTKVFSPINGYIGKSSVTAGALVTARQTEPLAIVRQLDPVYVDMSQSNSKAMEFKEKMGNYLTPGDLKQDVSVSLEIPELNNPYPVKGVLEARELAVNPATGALDLVAIFPNPDLTLLPGMFVNAYVEGAGLSSVPLVPQIAVMRDENGEAFVWKVGERSRALKQRIVTGTMYENYWTVKSGLQEGDQVAMDHLGDLQPSQVVEAVSVDQAGKYYRGE